MEFEPQDPAILYLSQSITIIFFLELNQFEVDFLSLATKKCLTNCYYLASNTSPAIFTNHVTWCKSLNPSDP